MKNDYFDVAYRILEYLYSCFMAGTKPDTDFFDCDAIKINRGYWFNVMRSLCEEGYIRGIEVISGSMGITGVKITNIRITQSGIIFLQENSMIAKARVALKTAKEIIPGI